MVAVARVLYVARTIVQRELAIERLSIIDVYIVHATRLGHYAFLEKDRPWSSIERASNSRSDDRQNDGDKHFTKSKK